MSEGTKVLLLTGKRINELRSGLGLIKGKRLPDGDAESLVASLWGLLEPSLKAFDEAMKGVQQRAPEIDAMEDAVAQAEEFAKYRKDLDQVESAIYEVRKPRTILGRQHLPKTYKGEAGQLNATGNAAAIIALRPEFFHDKNIDALQDEAADEGAAADEGE